MAELFNPPWENMFNKDEIHFRKLQVADLSLLHKWLNEVHVRQWYDKDKSCTQEDINTRYFPKITGEKPIQAYIVSYENKPIGYIQTYKISDFPDALHLAQDDNQAGVDLFIGNLDFIGKGFGSLTLRKFLKDIVFTQEGVDSCIIDPEVNNLRAIKAYEKAGFRYVKTVNVSEKGESKYIMKIDKNSLTE